jgi:TonB family protein
MATFARELKAIPDRQCLPPEYTPTPKAAEQIGTVYLKYDIAADGNIIRVTAQSDGMYMLEQLTLRYMGGCRVPPLELAGKTVQYTATVPVEWKLEGVSNPRVLVDQSCKPQYPSGAIRREAKGTTVLGLRVSEQGEILHVSINSSSGHQDLDRAALEAIGKCKAIAGTSAGRPREKTTSVIFQWRLD